VQENPDTVDNQRTGQITMPAKSVAQKLFIKAGHSVLSISAPKNHKALLGAPPSNAKLMTKASAPAAGTQH
jgi:hypothetical protein